VHIAMAGQFENPTTELVPLGIDILDSIHDRLQLMIDASDELA
jgi:hypothetical protein